MQPQGTAHRNDAVDFFSVQCIEHLILLNGQLNMRDDDDDDDNAAGRQCRL